MKRSDRVSPAGLREFVVKIRLAPAEHRDLLLAASRDGDRYLSNWLRALGLRRADKLKRDGVPAPRAHA